MINTGSWRILVSKAIWDSFDSGVISLEEAFRLRGSTYESINEERMERDTENRLRKGRK